LDRLLIAAAVVCPFFTLLFLSLKVCHCSFLHLSLTLHTSPCSLQLDGAVVWDWNIVLIPLWLLFCLIVCLPICMLCSSCCCRNWCEDHSRPMDDRWVFFLVMGLCWVFLLTPFATWFVALAFLVFESSLTRYHRFALTSLNLDGNAPDRPWRLIFVPIFLVEGLLFGSCVIGDIIALCCN